MRLSAMEGDQGYNTSSFIRQLLVPVFKVSEPMNRKGQQKQRREWENMLGLRQRFNATQG